MPILDGARLSAFADRIELDAAGARMLRHLIPGVDGAVAPGRYRCLTTTLERDAELRRALLAENAPEKIGPHATRLLNAHREDVRFLQGLAVAFWESAAATPASEPRAERLWVTGTALWIRILASEPFWRYFAKDRLTSFGDDSRGGLEPEHQDGLLRTALQGILSHHMAQARRAYAVSQFDAARIHLRCLQLCRRHADELQPALDRGGIPCALPGDPERLAAAAAAADELLDDWALQLVRESEKAADDPDAIGRLPPGIRRAYEKGIESLSRFVALEVPNVRALRTSLGYANDWCYDLYVTRQMEKIAELMVSARAVAERLAALCTEGLGHTPENQVLSMHYMFRGFADPDHESAVRQFEAALRWNPANDNAQQLLGDRARALLREQLQTAVLNAEQGRFDEAYGIIESIGGQMKGAEDQELVRKYRARVCFQHANLLYAKGRFREALARAKQSQADEPEVKEIADFVAELEGLAPEEDNLGYLHIADECMKKEEFQNAIDAAVHVGPGSKFHGRARSLLSAAHYNLGLEAAGKEDFQKAVACLERSLSLNDNDEEKTIIRRQLQGMTFRRGIAAANREDFDAGIRDLEAALALNPKSEHAGMIGEQLDVLKNVRFARSINSAMESNDWEKAKNILRAELAKPLPAARRKEMRTHLSQVLNAEAVHHMTEWQKGLKPLEDGIGAVMVLARGLQSGPRRY